MRKNPFQEIYSRETFKKFATYRFPEIVDVELTNNCNLNCKMCARQNMTRLKGFMSKETFESLAFECIQNNAGVRLIGWGEPFLHPQIVEFCGYVKSQTIIDPLSLKEKSSPVHITTNGQLIKVSQMEELVKIGLDSIIFSMQGATKEGYETMRVGSNYDKLKENILKLKEIRGDNEKPFIQISSTMTFETKDEISEFVDYWGKIVDEVVVGKTQPLEYPKDEYIYYKPCLEVFHKLTVKWDGQVSCCCADSNNMLVVGAIGQNTLFNIWNNNQVLDSIRKLLLNNKQRSLSLCKNCTHAYESFL